MMARSSYLNFDDYAANSPEYLMRVLKGQLFRPRSKIEFQDGTAYHVTRSGSRYWSRGDYMHRETGPASQFWYGDGRTNDVHYLFSVSFSSVEHHAAAVVRLNHLRELTDNRLETQVETIAQNTSWQTRQQLWRSILTGSPDADALLARLERLSKQYSRLAQMSDKFIQDFS